MKVLNDLLYNKEEINTIKENCFNYKKEMLLLPTPEEIIIDIAAFAVGVYFVELNNGKEKAVKKFIKN